MQLAELIEKAEQGGIKITPAQAEKRLKNAGVDPNGDLSEDAIAHLQSTTDLTTPTSKDQPQGKGELTKAHSGLAKTAVQSTQKQMVTIADKAARAGAVAYATRSAQNLNALATEIAGLTETAMQVYDTVEGGDDEDPLALPPLNFGLT
ncbi:MAG: hypothetical protein KME13_24295 [Myxacorys californica WJT36-NPBG1]|jgi:hypothetical protein|nr:hypothetical protein [Myxacorys californica WJT36-NPBG1]